MFDRYSIKYHIDEGIFNIIPHMFYLLSHGSEFKTAKESPYNYLKNHNVKTVREKKEKIPKDIIKSGKSNRDRQYNGQKIKDK